MFIVLHSSAGAGKTHALVKRYLTLAFKDGKEDAYTHILALTFTNKAAAEMRERILEYLEILASGEAPVKATGKDVLEAVMKEAGIDAAEVHRRAQAMLTHMLHHWSQLAVTTIDAFTRRVVMPFTRELQLDQELQMTTEEEYYRGKAIDLLLEETDGNSPLTEVLVATCEQLLEEGKSWRVDKPLMELSKQLTKEEAVEHLAQLKQMSLDRFIEARDRLRQRTDEFREMMRRSGKRVMDAVRAAGLTQDDFPYRRSSYLNFFSKLESFDDWVDPSTRFEKAMKDANWYTKKVSTTVAEAIEGLVPLMCEVYEEVKDRRDRMKEHVFDLALMRDLLPTASLNSIDERLKELKREEGVSFFSDLTREVMQIVQKEPAPFIYERLGERYGHFLVDEFQDTSLMQWHALLPLVENALSKDGSVFLVGDAKQAIYRWRNGEVRQFSSFPQVFRKEMLDQGENYENMLMRNHREVPPLDSNYRSAAGIVDFNNGLTERLKGELEEGERVIYQAHGQQKISGSQGYVEVSTYAGTTNGDTDEEKRRKKLQPWKLMAEAVKDSLADGFSKGDMAVLVRSGRQGALASQYLAEQGWDVIAPDGLTLGHSPVATGVVNVLAWLHRRDDETAARAAQSIAVLGAEQEVDPFEEGQTPKSLLEAWRKDHPLIHPRQPLVALVSRIARALGHDPATNGFAMGLLNEAHAFALMNGDDLPGFLEHWERTAHKRAAGGTPGGDAIRVMTVHKAKGLQFPVVIIPEAGKRTGGGRSERIWVSPGSAMPELPVALVQYKAQLWQDGGPRVPEAVEEEQMARLDELNVLYVAITRPEQRLYMSVPMGREAGFLANAIRDHLGLEDEGMWRSAEARPRKEERKKDEVGTMPTMGLSADPSSGMGELAIRLEAPEEWDPSSPDLYRSRGKAIHAILARVHTPKDLPTALEREGTGWGLTAEEMERVGKELEAVLAKPELAAFYGEGLEVHTEATLLDDQGQAWRPDRVVREGERYRVLDIKTGKPNDGHREQVRNYARLLQEVEGKEVEGYLLYVREGEVVRVDG